MTRVLVVRSGGFAGLTYRGEVDTDALPSEAAARWHLALGELSVLAAAPPGPGPAADTFRWHVEFDETIVVVGEHALPDDVRGLLEETVRPE